MDVPSEARRVHQDNCKPAEAAAGWPAGGKQQLDLLRSEARAVAVASAWPFGAYPYCANEEEVPCAARPYGCGTSLGHAGGHRGLRDVPPCQNVFQTLALSTARFAWRPKSGEARLFSRKEAAKHREVLSVWVENRGEKQYYWDKASFGKHSRSTYSARQGPR